MIKKNKKQQVNCCYTGYKRLGAAEQSSRNTKSNKKASCCYTGSNCPEAALHYRHKLPSIIAEAEFRKKTGMKTKQVASK